MLCMMAVVPHVAHNVERMLQARSCGKRLARVDQVLCRHGSMQHTAQATPGAHTAPITPSGTSTQP